MVLTACRSVHKPLTSAGFLRTTTHVKPNSSVMTLTSGACVSWRIRATMSSWVCWKAAPAAERKQTEPVPGGVQAGGRLQRDGRARHQEQRVEVGLLGP